MALISGALVIGSLLHGLAAQVAYPPFYLLGLVAMGCAWCTASRRLVSRLQSRWLIPQKWARAGRVRFAAIFGWILGLSFLTRISSVGFYALAAWGLGNQDFKEVWIVFGSYGLFRALPLIAISGLMRSRRGHKFEGLQEWERFAYLLRPAEVFLLVAAGVTMIFESAS